MRKTRVYQVNHKSFQTIPVWGDADLINFVEYESCFKQSLDTALNWLSCNDYCVMPYDII